MVKLADFVEGSISKRNINDDDVVTFIGMQDVSEDAKIISQHPINFSNVKNGFTYFERGDVLVAKITPCFENGKGAFLDKLETNIGFGSTEFHVLRANLDADPRYIYQHTITKAFRYKLALEMVGTAGHKRVPLSAIESYELPKKHNKDQQTAIADALSDVDALIGSLETLIAKKRDIKTGTMQQLLTGKKRLPGFGEGKGTKQTELGEIPEDWDVRTIGKVAPLQRGFDLPTRLISNGEYPVAYSNGIQNYHSEYMVKGPGVFTGRSGTIGKVNYVERNYWPHNTSLWVTDFKENIPKFIYFLFSSIGFERFSGGSGVPTLNRNDLHEFMVRLPKSNEQKAIAEAISDTDLELEKFEKRLTKTKAIKQGMMQELLTGKTRLA